MKYSIVIPTNRNFENTIWLFESIFCQTILPIEIIVVLDSLDIDLDQYTSKLTKLSESLWSQNTNIKISSPQNDKNFVWSGASYVRNYGISKVSSDFLISVDDDNTFGSDFCEKILLQAKYLTLKWEKKIVICPTEICDWVVRCIWYVWFDHSICRPQKSKFDEEFFKKNNWLGQINFCSSNCFFMTKNIFEEFKFDESMSFLYEDFLFFRQISQKYNIWISNVQIFHNMRKKTKLEDLYISTPYLAYQKSRNRIILVKKTSNKIEKFLFFALWLWLHTIYLIRNILYHIEDKSKKTIIKSIIDGTIDWIKFDKNTSKI